MIDKVSSSVKRIDERTAFTLAIMAILLIDILIFFMIDDRWGDVHNYYRNISAIIDDHLMPYSQSAFEYPPFTLVFFAIPKLLSWDEKSFCAMYGIMSMIFVFIGFYYITKISNHYEGSPQRNSITFILLIVFSSTFILSRNDIITTTLLIITLWEFINKKYVTASLVLAIATMTKMYPAFLILALIIPFLAKWDWRTILKCAAVFIVTCLVIELPFMIDNFSTAFAYLTYHSDRGIQIESIIGSFILLYNVFVPGTVTIVHNYGSMNLAGQFPEAISPFMNPIMVIALVVFALFAVYKMRKNRTDDDDNERNTICLAIICSIMIFILFSKVYSAQYMIWFMMLIPLSQIPAIPKNRKNQIMIAFIILGIFSMISGNFTCEMMFESKYAGLENVGVTIDVLKNICHIALTVILIKTFYECIYAKKNKNEG